MGETVSPPPAVPAPTTRDPRIDFFRGLALLVMGVDHAEELASTQAISYFTYAPIGISTAAEVFIFLSGFTLGSAYEKTYLQKGYFLLHARCLVRAWQLFVMQVLCLVLTASVLQGIPKLFGVAAESVPISGAIQVNNLLLWKFVTIQANPRYFDILPLYIVFLIFLPVFFVLLNRSLPWGLGLSAALYLVVQGFAAADRVELLPFSSAMYYNPMAWQFLFVIGMALGVRRHLGAQPPRMARLWLWSTLALLALACFWYKIVRLNILFGWYGGDSYVHGMSIPYDIPWIDKPTLGPIRLLHFCLVALVVNQLLPIRMSIWQSWLVRPVLVTGQQALEVFIFGIIFNYAVAAVMQITGGGRLEMILLDVATLLFTILFAHLVSWRKAEPWRLRGKPANS